MPADRLRRRVADSEHSVEHGERLLKRGEPYWPAQLAVAGVLILYLTLPEKLTVGPTWLMPALEGALLLGLLVTTPRRHHDESPLRRRAAIGLIGLITLANAISLVLLVYYLLRGGRAGGHPLILSAVVIWATNVVIFGLWYWEVDRGGPGSRAHGAGAVADFLFPQMSQPGVTHPDWQPGFVDYLYVSYTNATAFSPTDTMPLTALAKLLMLVEALVSLTTVALVAARAVNILS